MKLAENIRSRVRKSFVQPAHASEGQPLPYAPSAGPEVGRPVPVGVRMTTAGRVGGRMVRRVPDGWAGRVRARDRLPERFGGAAIGTERSGCPLTDPWTVCGGAAERLTGRTSHRSPIAAVGPL